jgi:hypothetical protein
MDKLTATRFADCIGALLAWLESSARPRQGREYYHINYGLLGDLRSIPSGPISRPLPNL